MNVATKTDLACYEKVPLFNCTKYYGLLAKALWKYSCENFIRLKPQMFSPANISTFTVTIHAFIKMPTFIEEAY